MEHGSEVNTNLKGERSPGSRGLTSGMQENEQTSRDKTQKQLTRYNAFS